MFAKHLRHILRKLQHLPWQTELKMVKKKKQNQKSWNAVEIIFRTIFESVLFNVSI